MNTTLTHRPGVQFESRLRKTGRTIQNWQHDMKNAYQIAQQNAKKTAERGRESYKKSLSGVLKPGDRVLVRNLTERGRLGKLRSHWEHVIHLVLERMGFQIPVYKVKPESGGGRTRVLQRNSPFPSSPKPLHQSKAWCTTIHMKLSLICM